MTLKIQSGTARGRILRGVPKGYVVRPILARIRKSIFDILRPRMESASFLDFFAGTGTVGLEALSNGAKRVIFVEINKYFCRSIEQNVTAMGFGDRCEVRQGDVTKNLFWLSEEKFDFLFLGPPYRDANKNPLALTVPVLIRIQEAGLLQPGGWVLAQHFEKESLEGAPSSLKMFRQEKYGDTLVSFFKENS